MVIVVTVFIIFIVITIFLFIWYRRRAKKQKESGIATPFANRDFKQRKRKQVVRPTKGKNDNPEAVSTTQMGMVTKVEDSGSKTQRPLREDEDLSARREEEPVEDGPKNEEGEEMKQREEE